MTKKRSFYSTISIVLDVEIFIFFYDIGSLNLAGLYPKQTPKGRKHKVISLHKYLICVTKQPWHMLADQFHMTIEKNVMKKCMALLSSTTLLTIQINQACITTMSPKFQAFLWDGSHHNGFYLLLGEASKLFPMVSNLSCDSSVLTRANIHGGQKSLQQWLALDAESFIK